MVRSKIEMEASATSRFSSDFGLGAATYLSEYSSRRFRKIFQPVLAAKGNVLVDGKDRSGLGDIIGSRRFRERGVFEADVTSAAFDRWRSGKGALAGLWTWLSTEHWFRQYHDTPVNAWHRHAHVRR